MGHLFSCANSSSSSSSSFCSSRAVDRFMKSMPEPYTIDAIEHDSGLEFEEKTMIFRGWREVIPNSPDGNKTKTRVAIKGFFVPQVQPLQQKQSSSSAASSSSSSSSSSSISSSLSYPNDLFPLFVREILMTKFATFLSSSSTSSSSSSSSSAFLDSLREQLSGECRHLIRAEDAMLWLDKCDENVDDGDDDAAATTATTNNNNNNQDVEQQAAATTTTARIVTTTKNKRQKKAGGFFLALVLPWADTDLSRITGSLRKRFPECLASPSREMIAKVMISQLLRACVALHSLNIAHRDIKPSNVLLYEPNEEENGFHNRNNNRNNNNNKMHRHKIENGAPFAVLADFGLSRLLWTPSKEVEAEGQQQSNRQLWTNNYHNKDRSRFHVTQHEKCHGECCPFTDFVASRWYRAPELLFADYFYTTAVDIWAVGCVLFELVAGGRILFHSSNSSSSLFSETDTAETHPQHFKRMMLRLRVRPSMALLKSLSPDDFVLPGFEKIMQEKDIADNNELMTVDDVCCSSDTAAASSSSQRSTNLPATNLSATATTATVSSSTSHSSPSVFKYDWNKIADNVILSSECRDVLDAMLQLDPSRRLSAQEILKMPFFGEIGDDDESMIINHKTNPHINIDVNNDSSTKSSSETTPVITLLKEMFTVKNHENENEKKNNHNDNDEEEAVNDAASKAFSLLCGCRDFAIAASLLCDNDVLVRRVRGKR